MDENQARLCPYPSTSEVGCKILELLGLVWMHVYPPQSICIEVVIHFNTHGLRWIYAHPNKALGIRTAGPSIDLGSTPYLLVLTKNQ
jgi:hypothetical protein